MRIQLLPPHVRNQIAAGEVVERPASVVKELVENALDAGAARVQVDLAEGGASLIRVTDDGCGMGPEDLEMAFVPHATSKLATVDDLEHIASLGFRGEALASIGAVSQASIRTRRAEDAVGHRVENDWGEVADVQEAGGPLGTAVEVRDLFLRLPARRRFLKRPATELARALDVLQRLVVAHEGVAFVVTHDGKRVLDVEAGMDRRARVRRLFGADLAEGLVEVEGRDGTTSVSGLLAPPRFSRTDTTRQMWFLNGRPLRDKVLIRVLKQAYRGLSIDNRQPVAFLSLAMDPSMVDVNVSPTKTDVRFREDRRLFGFLVATLRRALEGCDLATPGEAMLRIGALRERREAERGLLQPVLPDPGPRAPASSAPGERVHERPQVVEVPGRAWEPSHAGGAGGAPGSSPHGPTEDPWSKRDEFAGPFVRVARTYVLRELPDGFEIVDQHALHERVTFERLKRQLAEGGVEVQRLLVPELVEVSRAEVRAVEPHTEGLAAIGVHLERFGETTLALHGVPALVRHLDPEGLVRDLVARLERLGTTPPPQELLEEVLHSQACRSSVMAGDALSDEDIGALLRSAVEVGGAQTCPHGRPTRVRFTLADLERAFHRR